MNDLLPFWEPELAEAEIFQFMDGDSHCFEERGEDDS